MHLTTDQAQQVHDPLRPTLGYLSKLKRRMHELRVDEKDPLFAQVIEAQHAMQGLVVMLHYDSCWNGVGKPSSGNKALCPVKPVEGSHPGEGFRRSSSSP